MSEIPQLPQPDPALWRPDRLAGRWSTEGRLVGGWRPYDIGGHRVE